MKKKRPATEPEEQDKMLKLERRQLKKNKGCKLRFVIFGHFRFPSQNNICEKLVLSSSKNPQK